MAHTDRAGGVEEKPMTIPAVQKLQSSWQRTESLLSIGLEPATRYLPERFGHSIQERERFLRTIIDATLPVAAAYKFNLAHFESLGSAGWALLERIRSIIPSETLVILDGKRADIGSSSEHYASAAFDLLEADAVTANPLMGFDAVEPFLRYSDRLTFILALTSNPGADDFLLPGDLYKRIVAKAVEWNTSGQVGLVAGATRAEQLAEIRQQAPDLPLLIPGVGAQAGDLLASVRAAKKGQGQYPGFLIHVTRGILPQPGDPREAHVVIAERASLWHSRIREACQATTHEET